MLSIAAAAAIGLVLLALVRRRRRGHRGKTDHVSAAWLAEQRGRR